MMNPKVAEVLKAHGVDEFEIMDDQVNHTITLKTKPPRPDAVIEDLKGVVSAMWGIEWVSLEDKYNFSYDPPGGPHL